MPAGNNAGSARSVKVSRAFHADPSRFDPVHEKVARRFYKDPDQFADAFDPTWFKLAYRNMGLQARISSSGKAAFLRSISRS
jgi:catalase (peroxidase I)